MDQNICIRINNQEEEVKPRSSILAASMKGRLNICIFVAGRSVYFLQSTGRGRFGKPFEDGDF